MPAKRRMQLMIQDSIKIVVENKNLSADAAFSAMEEIMSGAATPSQIASLLTALRMKGETSDEIIGFAKAMRKFSSIIRPKNENLVDTCGTGGDVSNTFNISTVSAFVAAGAGVAIAKHGNRSVSSKCGSADLLEGLGLKIDLQPAKVEECINKIGIGFIFAPVFHPAMKFAMPTRREIGIRTAFNILGPLTNPANAPAQLLGVFDEKLTEVMAEALNSVGVTQAFVVHGMDGLDEISISGKTKITHLKDETFNTYYIEPADFGITRASKDEIKALSVSESVKIADEILNVKKKGPKRDIVLLNSAAAIVLGKKAENIAQAITIAEKSIDSGAAYNKLISLVNFTNS